ncbi:hypothetical protein [Clostridium mediterraneense]|nr:hypothetical protein [Clostridium mediterraneense]
MTKQSPCNPAYGNPGLTGAVPGNPLGLEDGYLTLLSASTSSEDPSIASLNNMDSSSIPVSFLVVGNNLLVNDAGALFIATRN